MVSLNNCSPNITEDQMGKVKLLYDAVNRGIGEAIDDNNEYINYVKEKFDNAIPNTSTAQAAAQALKNAKEEERKERLEGDPLDENSYVNNHLSGINKIIAQQKAIVDQSVLPENIKQLYTDELEDIIKRRNNKSLLTSEEREDIKKSTSPTR